MSRKPPLPAGARSRPTSAKPSARRNIVWLASYPKSGNTWTRIFLANYLFDRQTPMPINEVHRLGMGDSIAKTYRMVAGGPIDTADHTATLPLRNRVLAGITANGADVNFVKTHNARIFAFGHELIPPTLTRAAAYIIRNPLDLVLSYRRHYGGTLEETVERIARTDNAVTGDADSVAQFLGNWSDHVVSWTRKPRFPTLVLRYEDLHRAPEEHFARLLEHIGITPQAERLERAIGFASFKEVRAQEEKTSFVEKAPAAERFFTSGTSGQWRDALPESLAERIRATHGKVMRAHGYLP